MAAAGGGVSTVPVCDSQLVDCDSNFSVAASLFKSVYVGFVPGLQQSDKKFSSAKRLEFFMFC